MGIWLPWLSAWFGGRRTTKQHLQSPYLPGRAHTFPRAGMPVGKIQSAAVVTPPSPNGLLNLKKSVFLFILYFCHKVLITSWVPSLGLSSVPPQKLKQENSPWYSSELNTSLHQAQAGAMPPPVSRNNLGVWHENGLKSSRKGCPDTNCLDGEVEKGEKAGVLGRTEVIAQHHGL